jgi:hypothetical protein
VLLNGFSFVIAATYPPPIFLRFNKFQLHRESCCYRGKQSKFICPFELSFNMIVHAFAAAYESGAQFDIAVAHLAACPLSPVPYRDGIDSIQAIHEGLIFSCRCASISKYINDLRDSNIT